MKAVITVVGKDRVGILAGISTKCAEYGISIDDVSQTVMQDMFCMIMMCDIKGITVPFNDFCVVMTEYGKDQGLSIHTMHEEIINTMHRI